MKHKTFLTAICCAFAVGLLAVCSADAAMVAQSGFNHASGIADPAPLTAADPLNPSTGDLNGQGGAGLSWTIPWTHYRPDAFAGVTKVTDMVTPVSEGDQAAHSVGSTTQANWSCYGRMFTAQTSGQVLIEFSVYLENVGGAHDFESMALYVSDYDDGDLSLAGANSHAGLVSIRPASGGGYVNQQYSGSSLVKAFPNGSVQPDTWYKLGLLFDMDAQTYQVSLDDLEGEVFDGSYADPHPFVGPTTRINTFFWTNQHASTYFDDFKVTTIIANVPVPGDTNNDKKVDAADAAHVAQFWGATVTKGEVAKGDFNNDGLVNAADASIMAANWGDHNPPPAESTAAVPEPTTVVLLLGALMGLAVLRRR